MNIFPVKRCFKNFFLYKIWFVILYYNSVHSLFYRKKNSSLHFNLMLIYFTSLHLTLSWKFNDLFLFSLNFWGNIHWFIQTGALISGLYKTGIWQIGISRLLSNCPLNIFVISAKYHSDLYMDLYTWSNLILSINIIYQKE